MNNELLEMMKTLLKEHGQIPQGLKALGIRGRRDSDARYTMYGLDAVLTDKFDVLDIGCNVGFLSCILAQKVHKVTGIDIDPLLIRIANLAAGALEIRNCVFFQEDLKRYHPVLKSDLIVASQVHHWVKIPFGVYVDKLIDLLKDKGYLLFESHDTDNVDADIDDKIGVIKG